MPRHPIFDDIENGNLANVQRRVRADPAVLDERYYGWTPLMHAICNRKPDISLWLIEHRGDHDVDTTAREDGTTALHFACECSRLAVVKALVTAGASTTTVTALGGWTPLMLASSTNRADVVAFLLSLPPVHASVDAVNNCDYTVLFFASRNGHEAIVALLLDAGADPTIPAGLDSPLVQAINNGRHDVAFLLCQAISNRRVALPLLKARTLIEASQPNAPVPGCLQGRVARNQPLPTLAINDGQQQQQRRRRRRQQSGEELRATLRFVLGLEGHGGWAGAEDERATMRAEGLFSEVFVELLEYLLPAPLARAAAGGMQ